MRWEYVIVEVHTDGAPKGRYWNGSELPNWKKGPHIGVFLNQLGAEGWELVSWTVKRTDSVGMGLIQHEADRYHAVLKRQKP